MRLICPNCDAHYEVGDDAIPDAGRDVQCSACGHAWFQTPSRVRADALSFPKPDAWETQDTPKVPELPDDADAAADTAQTSAPQAPAPQTSAPQTSAPAAPVQRKPADDEMLEILRQEAAYEAEVRARERATLETQPDLGLRARISTPPTAAPAGGAAAERATGHATGQADERNDPSDDPAETRKPMGRRALPDIDDISSTLQPVTHPRRYADRQDVLPPTDEAESRGFTTGFVMVISAVVALAAVYIAAPSLSEGIPALADVLARYTATIDAMRIWVADTANNLMQSATDSLNNDTADR